MKIKLDKINKNSEISLSKIKDRIEKREALLQKYSNNIHALKTKNYVFQNCTDINFKKNFSNTKDLPITKKYIHRKIKTEYNFPSIPNKISVSMNNSFEKMKNYKIKNKKIESTSPKKHKYQKLINLLDGTGIQLKNPETVKKTKNGEKEETNVPYIKFDEYVKLQTKAEYRLRPKLGDMSYDLINYLDSIKNVRRNLISGILDEIKTAQNRYNDERPNEDTKVKLNNQLLEKNKWKNMFPLEDYQNYFMDQLRDKISKLNFKEMQKRFNQIRVICFSKGNSQSYLKQLNGTDY